MAGRGRPHLCIENLSAERVARAKSSRALVAAARNRRTQHLAGFRRSNSHEGGLLGGGYAVRCLSMNVLSDPLRGLIV